jgi:tRNA/rRNA methyltransferase
MISCRIVLVRTEIAGNIGAAARVMRNMGLDDLVLVTPVADPRDEQARNLATHHAADLLERCRVVADLGEAVADCVLVAGTSARTGGLYRRQSVGTPEEVMPRLVEASASGPVALVFGPEPSGLRNDEVVRCHHLIHIPADEAYPALNLAQAVAICTYQLRRACQQAGPARVADVAPFAEQERMFEKLGAALAAIRFLRGTRDEALMHAVRHLIGRALPSPMEVKVLIGLARQMQWVVKRADWDEGPASPQPRDEGAKVPSSP